MNGDWPLDVKLPLVGGHEGAGIVVARGELVQDIEIGDHAGVKVQMIWTQKSYFLFRLKAFFLTCMLSGSTVPVYNAAFANRQMSLYALKFCSLVTQSTAVSNNTASPKPHTSLAYPKRYP